MSREEARDRAAVKAIRGNATAWTMTVYTCRLTNDTVGLPVAQRACLPNTQNSIFSLMYRRESAA